MFKDREEAGRILAEKLINKFDLTNTAIVVIPRGGVVVGNVISRILGMPLFPLVVKKISLPQSPELALGAVGNRKITYWDQKIVSSFNLREKELDMLRDNKYKEVLYREKFLGIKIPDLKQKKAILVDDGVATGSTVMAASLILKKMEAKKIVLATPVISTETLEKIRKYFTEIIYILKSENFSAVGEFYKNFSQVTDEEIKKLLN